MKDAIVNELDKYIAVSKYDSTDDTLEYKTSIVRLREIQDRYGDVNNAKNVADNVNFHKLKPDGVEIPEGFRRTGFFYYPKGGYMGWHTNSKVIGKRKYVVYATEEKKSFFRYYDTDKEDIVTLWDKKGWNTVEFEIKKDEPFWHCVGSMCDRVSLGLTEL
tara:strand:- start:1715 stop:2197 length:483 start_codon:yes stop_codon:yes gene_type:complete